MNQEANNNQATKGTPDWKGGYRKDGLLILPAWEEERLFFALPQEVTLSAGGEGTSSSGLFLEFFSDKNGGTAEDATYAMLHMSLRVNNRADAARKELQAKHPEARLVADVLSASAYWHFECGDFRATHLFAWEGAEYAQVRLRLSQKAGLLLYGAFGNGNIATCRAAVENGVYAFLPRVEASVAFKLSTVLTDLKKLYPGGGDAVPYQAMVRYFREGHLVPPALSDVDAGIALAGRMCHYFGEPAPCLDIASGPFVYLRPAAGRADDVSWDLRTPLIARTPEMLNFNSFGRVIATGERATVTGFTKIPALPLDLLTRRVTVASALPPRIHNCMQISVTLLVEKSVARAGANEVKELVLHPGAKDDRQWDMKFAHRSPQPWKYKVTAVVDEDVRETNWMDGVGSYLYVDHGMLPGQLINVTATATLLEQAKLNVRLTGGKTDGSTAPLTRENPSVALLPSEIADDARLLVTAEDPEGKAPKQTIDLPLRSVRLDALLFPNYGPQSATVHVTTSGDAYVSFRPLGDTGDGVELHFSAETTTRTYQYFSTSLFQNGYQYRLSGFDNAGEWSVPQDPERTLNITIKQPKNV